MGTNQSKFSNTDGATTFYFYTNGDPLYDFTVYEPDERDGCHGMRLFAESRGYGVVTNFSQYIQGRGSDPAKGFTYSQYVAEIDAGRPVLIQVEGHTMLGYAYNTTGNVVYVRDTWDHSSHTMTWGGTYSGMQHYGVTVIRLVSTLAMTVETSGLVPSYPATVQYTQGGVPKTTTTCGSWSDTVDYGTTVSIDSSVGVSATERYSTNATTSWTATEEATYSVPYYHQFSSLVSAVTAGAGHVDLDSTNYATLTYYRYGSQGVFGVFDSYSFSDWADAGSTLTLASLSSGSTSTHRWYSSEATSWTVSDAGSHLATYWEQFKPTVSVATTGTGHADLNAANCVSLSYHAFGAAGTANVFDAQGFNDWVDTGSAVSLSSSSSASTASHRWYAAGTTSWVVNDANSSTASYWEQFKPTVSVATTGTGHTDLSATNYVALSYRMFGTAGTAYVFDAQSFNDWVDTGSIASLSNPSSASTSTHRWYALDTASWTVSDAGARSATYWEQYEPSVTIEGLSPSHLTDVAFTTNGEPMRASTSDVWSDWVDVGSVVSTSKSVEGGWIGDWNTGDADVGTADSAFSVTVNYTRGYTGVYILVGVLLLVAAMIGAGLFFLLRRRRKEA
jgi:hypothetical protein